MTLAPDIHLPQRPLPPSREACAALDLADPLAFARGRFRLAEGLIYFDGNSLGPLPEAVPGALAGVVDREWAAGLIGSWNAADWIGLPERVGARIAPLIGADPSEVLAADSTSINLFKLLVAALELRPGRRVIVSETGNFPTDRYLIEGACRLLGRGHTVRWVDASADEAAIEDALGDDVALLALTQVDYRSGRKLDLARLSAAAHANGALVLWDLAHSAGAFAVDLDAAGADFAVGCGYKYLNGGPGAPAFLYVARRWQDRLAVALPGWLGHARPFALEAGYRPAKGIRRLQVGTPPVLGLAALDAALGVWEGVDLGRLGAKAGALTDTFISLVQARLGDRAGRLVSPADARRRGAQVCYAHPEAYPMIQALIAEGVVGDFREPDILRFGFAPLYTRFVDLWDAVERWAAVLDAGRQREARFQARAAVT